MPCNKFCSQGDDEDMSGLPPSSSSAPNVHHDVDDDLAVEKKSSNGDRDADAGHTSSSDWTSSSNAEVRQSRFKEGIIWPVQRYTGSFEDGRPAMKLLIA